MKKILTAASTRVVRVTKGPRPLSMLMSELFHLTRLIPVTLKCLIWKILTASWKKISMIKEDGTMMKSNRVPCATLKEGN